MAPVTIDPQLFTSLINSGVSGAATSDLDLYRQSSLAQNPYAIAAPIIGGIKFDTSTWSPYQTAGVTAGQAFLSAMLGGLAQNRQAQEMKALTSVLPQLYSNPETAMAPEGVNQAGFEAVRQNAMARRNTAQAEQIAKLASDLWGVEVAGATAGKQKAATIAAENAAYGFGADGTTLNPNSPQYKMMQDTFDNERTLGNDFIKDSADFKYKEQGLKALVEAFQDKSGTSDYELIRRAAQMVEPGLAVRRDDEESLMRAASLLDTSLQSIRSAANGETKLGDDVRKGMMRIAKRSYDSALGDYNTIRQNYIDRAASARLNTKAVVPFEQGSSFLELYPDLNIGLQNQKTAEVTNQLLSAPKITESEVKLQLQNIKTEIQNPSTSFERKQQLQAEANALASKLYEQIPSSQSGTPRG